MSETTQKLVFIFDGSCGFCTACVEFFRLLDWRGQFQFLPFQMHDVSQRCGLTITQCEQEAWVVLPSGKMYHGAQAINFVLDTIIGIHLFELLFHLPGMRKLEWGVYAWVTAHRQWFPGVCPYCQRTSSPC